MVPGLRNVLASAIACVVFLVAVAAGSADRGSAVARVAGSTLVFDLIGKDAWGSINVVAPDGSGLRSLTDGDSPAWSPDHRRIAYVPPGIDDVILVVNATGRGKKSINVQDDDFRGNPRWSPDGKRIVYERYEGVAITTIATGGHQVVPLPFRAEDADWSPRGELLAFSRTDSFGSNEPGEIYVASADGTGVRQITRNGPDEKDFGVRWSPSGRSLLFIRETTTFVSGQGYARAYALYTVSGAGGTPRKLVSGGKRIGSATWSPDGAQIAYLREGRVVDGWHQNRIHIFDVARRRDVRVLQKGLCFSGDPSTSCRTIDW